MVMTYFPMPYIYYQPYFLILVTIYPYIKKILKEPYMHEPHCDSLNNVQERCDFTSTEVTLKVVLKYSFNLELDLGPTHPKFFHCSHLLFLAKVLYTKTQKRSIT